MPKWNLQDDWPASHRPKGKKTFSMPIRQLNIPLNKYSLEVEVEQQTNKCVSKGVKKLIIDIENNQNVEILAMTPGKISSTGACIKLKTDAFFKAGVLATASRYSNGSNTIPLAWFSNWMEADRIPGKIVYDNVVTGSKISGNVHTGDVIGTMGNHPWNAARKRLILSIEYLVPSNSETEGMHPREFFSLLFWNEDHDPIFKQSSTDYNHELLSKMLSTDEKGSTGSLNTFINAPADTWLGLRPPLRTFQRVKWEHIKEHLRASSESSWDWRSTESVKNRIFNNYVARGDGYVGKMKCNLYTGEMLFRAGFRTIIWARGYGKCSKSQVQNRLKYLSPQRIDKIFGHKECGIVKDKINYYTTTLCTNKTQATHEIYTCFGRKVTPNKSKINNAIQVFGDIYFVTTSAHVPIIHNVDNVTASNVYLSILDQNWKIKHNNTYINFSRNNYVRKKYNRSRLIVTIIRALPGGDPKEEWGMLKSNCLKTIPKGP